MMMRSEGVSILRRISLAGDAMFFFPLTADTCQVSQTFYRSHHTPHFLDVEGWGMLSVLRDVRLAT